MKHGVCVIAYEMILMDLILLGGRWVTNVVTLSVYSYVTATYYTREWMGGNMAIAYILCAH